MEILFALCTYLMHGYLGYLLVKCFYKTFGYKWTVDDEFCFLWTGLCLGPIALLGFCFWIGLILINNILKKVDLDIF